MNFFDRVGTMAIASRLRRVSEIFTENGRKIYQLYDVPLDPKWFPVFYVLSHAEEGLSTTEISRWRSLEKTMDPSSKAMKTCSSWWLSPELNSQISVRP